MSGARLVLWGIGTVVALALVIFGASALSSPSGGGKGERAGVPGGPATEAPRSEDAAATSSDLYERALLAQESGDATAALDLARQALAADAGNTKAKQLLVTLQSGSGAGTAGAEASTATPAMERVEDISSLLPAKITGYAFDQAQVLGKDAVVSADPEAASADARVVTHAIFSVHDRGSAEAAAEFVNTVNKRVYGHDRVAVRVLGAAGYFGTDGARLASVAFTRGPYAFEVVLTTLTDEPAQLRDSSVKLASSFRLP